MTNKPKRIYLFAQPSFLTGVARVMDWRGALNTYVRSPDGKTADHNAMYSDWLAVGDDLRYAIDEYRKKEAK